MNGYINLLLKCLLITKVIFLYFSRIINMQEVKYRILHDTIDMYYVQISEKTINSFNCVKNIHIYKAIFLT